MLWTLLLMFGVAFAKEAPLSCLTSNQNLATGKQIVNQSGWHSLLHMRKSWFGEISEVDGKEFFISPNGASSSSDELQATLKAFCENQERPAGPELKSRPARCVYPAREQYLESLGLGGWPKPACPEVEAWRQKLGNQGLHLVFSSYYANNPSSVFGHSLLRFDRLQSQGNQNFSPLLSQGVNFAADATTENGFLYAILGMTGGFAGRFASMPYYYKVREYSDFDSRDLWEYQLNLNAEQILLLQNHIWELSFTHFDYYYFSENCSYHLLTLIGLAVPEAHLENKVPPWVIPIDSVKAVTRTPHLVQDVRFRPSLYNVFLARIKRLDQAGLGQAFDLFLEKGQSTFPEYTDQQNALISDAILDYWDFKYTHDLLDPASNANRRKAELLRNRASLPVTPPLEFKMEDLERPDVSHESARVAINAGNESRRGSFLGLDLRFALHDPLDPPSGYPRNAEIDFFHFKGKFFERSREAQISEIKFFEVKLLSPMDKITKTYSWRAVLGADRSFLGCSDCLAGHLLLSGGASTSWSDQKHLAFLMAGGDLRLAADQMRPALLFPLLSAGLLTHWCNVFHSLIQADFYSGQLHDIPSSHEIRAELRYNLSLVNSLGLQGHQFENTEFKNTGWGLSLYHFF